MTKKAKRVQGFLLSEFDKLVYNACDAPGYRRGPMGPGKPNAARIYSVYRIEGQLAQCQSRDVWGDLHQEALLLTTLIPWKKPLPKKSRKR